MNKNLIILFYIVGLPLLGNSQEPTLNELKERTVNEMRKIKPHIYNDANIWRINIVPDTYEKTKYVEKWVWTIDNDPNEKGDYIKTKYLFKSKTDSISELTPNIELGTNIATIMPPKKISEAESLIINTLKSEDSNINSVSNIKIIKRYPEALGLGYIYRFEAKLLYTNGTFENMEGSFLKADSDERISWIYKYKID